MITITECTKVTTGLVRAMDRLIRQLSSSSAPPTRSELEKITASPTTTLFLALSSLHRPVSDAGHPVTEPGQPVRESLPLADGLYPQAGVDVSRTDIGDDHSSPPAETPDGLDEEVARGNNIVGTLTLVVFRIPTGVRARIEAVVVDESVRGQRIGERLSAAGLDRARALGAVNVDLSSRPSRKAANRLYQRMGFQLRKSNVYRYKL